MSQPEEWFEFKIIVRGFVQGVGFRPFVYRLAKDLQCGGWVKNGKNGVEIEIRGPQSIFNQFLEKLQIEKPQVASIEALNVIQKKALPFDSTKDSSQFALLREFSIRETEDQSNEGGDIIPDLATCSLCIEEIFDSSNRRYQYPFTNCTHCGPRFSITKALPYDRVQTTMNSFVQCFSCQKEYENPLDRRFHAQPNACPQCGPHLSLYDHKPLIQEIPKEHHILDTTVSRLRSGAIVALKGLGGYQLIVDAHHDEAVDRLRNRKKRPTKPFAVMMRSIEEIRQYCELNCQEEGELKSSAAPIVILKKKKDGLSLSESVAPHKNSLGVFLPYTPLHHLLMHQFGGPLVVTSGNASNEPMVFQEPQVFEKLRGLADFYLVHNRPIHHPIDDSVVQFAQGERIVLRAARGLTPMVFRSPVMTENLLAVGAHKKGAFAFKKGHRVILSQYLGDLEEIPSQELFESEMDYYQRLYTFEQEIVGHDLHPAYFSSEWAHRRDHRGSASLEGSRKTFAVQHHRAHIASVVLEKAIEKPFLGVAWDGTGLGEDGSIWGGEFFLEGEGGSVGPRVGRIKPFKLIGSSLAIKEPWRVALSLLFELQRQDADEWLFLFNKQNLFKEKPSVEHVDLLYSAWKSGFQAPLCSSLGRFMDGVSALLGLVFTNTYEGEAAITLESFCEGDDVLNSAPLFTMNKNEEEGIWEWDWRTWIKKILQDLIAVEESGLSWTALQKHRARELHLGLARGVFDWAEAMERKTIVLSGGVFQNQFLLEAILKMKEERGIEVILPNRAPINDGGIALGQIYAIQTSILNVKHPQTIARKNEIREWK